MPLMGVGIILASVKNRFNFVTYHRANVFDYGNSACKNAQVAYPASSWRVQGGLIDKEVVAWFHRYCLHKVDI